MVPLRGKTVVRNTNNVFGDELIKWEELLSLFFLIAWLERNFRFGCFVCYFSLALGVIGFQDFFLVSTVIRQMPRIRMRIRF